MNKKIYIVDNQLHNNTTMTYELVNGQKIPQPKDFKIPKKSEVHHVDRDKPEIVFQIYSIKHKYTPTTKEYIPINHVMKLYVNGFCPVIFYIESSGHPYFLLNYELEKPDQSKRDILMELLNFSTLALSEKIKKIGRAHV